MLKYSPVKQNVKTGCENIGSMYYPMITSRSKRCVNYAFQEIVFGFSEFLMFENILVEMK
jgi:hypothetical protein